ncbi:MAG: hypothetical protein KAR21_17560, partial [Spirochaetales bacterium]|nr:hypothetical protein [Spirochaetales bacterium]
RKNRIIPTILSRVRPYNFRTRSDAEDKNILKRIFKDDSEEYRNLRDYFMGMKGINLSILRQYANKSIDILIKGNEIDIEEFSEVLDIIKENHVLKAFLEEMLFLLQEKTAGYSDTESGLPITVLERWNKLIHKTMTNRLRYNQNTRLLFETLLYQMREAF